MLRALRKPSWLSRFWMPRSERRGGNSNINKTLWNRRYLALIDRWYPSSKTCNVCGAVNSALTLADRNWTCVDCGSVHDLDRDSNASLNIKAEGLKPLAVGHADSQNVQGADARPPQLEAVGVEL